MAAFSSLALLAAGAVGGALLGRGKKKKDPVTAPPPVAEQTPAEKVAETKPPEAVALESQNQAAAQGVGARTRRRAAAGSAGRATGGVSTRQRGPRAIASPRSLLGA